MDAQLDGKALETLFVALERPLYNVVYRWLWDAEEARDVVQEAFVRLWRERQRIDPATARPLAYKIALNLAANRRKWRRLRRFVGLEAVADEDRIVPGESVRGLRAAIDGLPEPLRRVVVMCELAEMSYAEVAAVLEIPAGTVASRRNRAMKRLRAALGVELATEEREVNA